VKFGEFRNVQVVSGKREKWRITESLPLNCTGGLAGGLKYEVWGAARVVWHVRRLSVKAAWNSQNRELPEPARYVKELFAGSRCEIGETETQTTILYELHLGTESNP
jgi:hypothetical protein